MKKVTQLQWFKDLANFVKGHDLKELPWMSAYDFC